VPPLVILLRCRSADDSREMPNHVTCSPRGAINLKGQLNNAIGLEFMT
jgi:hypothetical protein